MIIPAYNESASIGLVVRDIPGIVQEVIVVNNNSADQTSANARAAGATVIDQPKPGYGNACLKGMEFVAGQKEKPDIIVFIDGDHSDYAEELTKLVDPIINNNMDFVVGARVPRFREKNAMTPQQVWGNKLATFLMKIFFKSTFTDLGPFRAIRYDKLLQLQMSDKTYGWTVEMQLKALKQGLAYTEIPVHYRARIGVSKVSGTLKGTILAGFKIIGWILKYSLKK